MRIRRGVERLPARLGLWSLVRWADQVRGLRVDCVGVKDSVREPRRKARDEGDKPGPLARE
jgi:hypothetical protein